MQLLLLLLLFSNECNQICLLEGILKKRTRRNHQIFQRYGGYHKFKIFKKKTNRKCNI